MKIILCFLIFFELAGTGLYGLSFDTQEIVDSYMYPSVDKKNPEIMRNISLTLNAYAAYCRNFNIIINSNFIKQIRDGKTKIYLNTENLTYKETEAVSYALTVNTTVAYIEMNDNFIGDEGAEALSHMLYENKTIKTIELSNCYIGNEGVKSLLSVKRRNIYSEIKLPDLRPVNDKEYNLYLYLAACAKYDFYPQIRYIKFFESNPISIILPYISGQITNITQGINKINYENAVSNIGFSEEIKIITEIFKNVKSVKYCTLSGLELTNGETTEFLKTLLGNSGVSNIIIDSCNFNDKNSSLLFSNLENNNTIGSFTVRKCILSDNTMRLLIKTLKNNCGIKYFCFSDNSNSLETSAELIKTLYLDNQSINYLILKGLTVTNNDYLPLLKNKFPGKDTNYQIESASFLEH